jgi:hypothetical protein
MLPDFPAERIELLIVPPEPVTKCRVFRADKTVIDQGSTPK